LIRRVIGILGVDREREGIPFEPHSDDPTHAAADDHGAGRAGVSIGTQALVGVAPVVAIR